MRHVTLTKDTKGRADAGGYALLPGDPQLGQLISGIQAAAISCSTELERIIKDRVTRSNDLFLQQEIMQEDLRVTDKQNVKNYRTQGW